MNMNSPKTQYSRVFTVNTTVFTQIPAVSAESETCRVHSFTHPEAERTARYRTISTPRACVIHEHALLRHVCGDSMPRTPTATASLLGMKPLLLSSKRRPVHVLSKMIGGSGHGSGGACGYVQGVTCGI